MFKTIYIHGCFVRLLDHHTFRVLEFRSSKSSHLILSKLTGDDALSLLASSSGIIHSTTDTQRHVKARLVLGTY
jgi:hypothetical protein